MLKLIIAIVLGFIPSLTQAQFVNPVVGGTGTVTSVDGSGGTTGLTVSGGPITTSGTLTLAGILAATNGGTGQSTYTIGDLLYASSGTALSKLPSVAAGSMLRSGGVGAAPTWSTAYVSSFSAGTTGLTPNTGTTGAVTLAGTIDVDNGGTGQTTYTNGQLLIGNTTGNTLTKSTLTAGNGLTITNGTGTIALAANLTGSSGIAVTPGTATDIAITAGAIPGVATNSAATAGTIGEYITATAGPTSIANSTVTNITSISLTSGDWDVCGSYTIAFDSTTVRQFFNAGISTSSTVYSQSELAGANLNGVTALAGIVQQGPVPCIRATLSGTTTYYLNAAAGFTISTATATAHIWARRAR